MLEKLPSGLHNLTSLRVLRIGNCRRLSCLSEMDFPSTMELLVIYRCELLTCLSPSSHSLKDLDISNCEVLESLVGTADSFPSLESLRIEGCPKLKSLPIEDCQNLRELSISVHHLPALETLGICCCPNPNSLPPNLRKLYIDAPRTPNDDDKLFSVPLPSSLTFLWISKFKKLSPEAFQNLTSLQSLYIEDCPELTSIPDQLLPPSLRSLHIRGCPLLAPDFAKGKGRYWPKVKFIPLVEIDYRSIFEAEEEE